MKNQQQIPADGPERDVDEMWTSRSRRLYWIKRSLWLLLYPAAWFSVSFLQQQPELVETVYSQGIYPPISEAVGAVFSVFPFSFAEVLVWAIAIFVVAFIVVCLRTAVKRRLSLQRFLGWLMSILIVIGAGINAFYWMWGFNYFREPLRSRLGIVQSDKQPERLAALCFQLASTANALRPGLSQDSQGVFTYEGGKAAALALIPAAYERLGSQIELFSRKVYRPKQVFMSEVLSYAGIAGIYIPFTEEANVNVAEPALLIGSSAAHETAHFLGIASEDEANFVAYLACCASDDPSIQYSGTMLALVHAGNALSRVSSQAYTALWESYSDAVVRDLDQYNSYLNAHQGKTADRVQDMNDKYLKANGQASGVASYGQMVDLLLDFYSL